MTLSQYNFICKVTERFKIQNSNLIYTPIETDLNLVNAEKVNVNLLYFSITTRPHVSFALNYFSRFMNS